MQLQAAAAVSRLAQVASHPSAVMHRLRVRAIANSHGCGLSCSACPHVFNIGEGQDGEMRVSSMQE